MINDLKGNFFPYTSILAVKCTTANACYLRVNEGYRCCLKVIGGISFVHMMYKLACLPGFPFQRLGFLYSSLRRALTDFGQMVSLLVLEANFTIC